MKKNKYIIDETVVIYIIIKFISILKQINFKK